VITKRERMEYITYGLHMSIVSFIVNKHANCSVSACYWHHVNIEIKGLLGS
jgi:hypothetical protein